MNYKSALLHGLTARKYQNFIMVAPQGRRTKVKVRDPKIIKVLTAMESKRDNSQGKVKEDVVGTLAGSKQHNGKYGTTERITSLSPYQK